MSCQLHYQPFKSVPYMEYELVQQHFPSIVKVQVKLFFLIKIVSTLLSYTSLNEILAFFSIVTGTQLRDVTFFFCCFSHIFSLSQEKKNNNNFTYFPFKAKHQYETRVHILFS